MPTKANPDIETNDLQEESEVVRYELMIIVTPDVTQADYEKHVEEVKTLLGAHNAKIRHTDDWGKRDLAYSIKKKEHGYYYIFDVEMDPNEAPELNKQLRITPFVLRCLMVKLPENYTSQKYDLEPPKRPEYKPETAETKYARPGASAYKPRVAVHARPAAAVAKPVAAKEFKPKVEPQAKPKEDLSKLDEKLEELLSGDNDLNL